VVHTHPVWRRSGESQIHYIVVDDLRTLAWATSVSTLEFHPFLARVADINRPTSVVFDLDPGEPAGVLDCGKVALWLQELASRLNLQTFAKVSGSKAIQVYIPLNTPTTYEETAAFAKSLADDVASQHPKFVISQMERAQRKGKVFVDWSQNADYKTTVSAYSLRAKRRHPYISMPLSWQELDEAISLNESSRLYFLPNEALDRMRSLGDLFAPMLTVNQHLPEAFESLGGARRPARHNKNSAERSGISKLLHMPSTGSQGGRRRFVLSRAANDVTQLRLELHDAEKVWKIHGDLPTLGGHAVEAEEVRVGSRRSSLLSSTVTDTDRVGVWELIEGSVARDYLDLFLTTKTFAGKWMLQSDSSSTRRWRISRPSKYDSGLASTRLAISRIWPLVP
jgi:DNA ligase D-like protein (predicted polymerase)